MMEEYTDICSLLGLEDIDMKPPALHDKQTIIEETLCDPSDLLDFLVSEQLRPSYSSLLSNLNIDINLNINGRKYELGSELNIIQIITPFFQTCQTVMDLVWPRMTGLECQT